MTSILTFQLDNGNQRIVIGDTQHIYRASTCENSKIFPLKDRKIFSCGAGNDRIIDGINTRIISIDDLDFCADKISKFKEEDFSGGFVLYEFDDKIRLKEIQSTQFMLLSSSTLEGKKIINSIPIPINNVEIIGTGEEFIGLIRAELEALYSVTFNDENKDSLLGEVLKNFCKLGWQDSSTGHPAVFPLEGYLFEKGKSPKQIHIKSLHKPQEISNYSREVFSEW